MSDLTLNPKTTHRVSGDLHSCLQKNLFLSFLKKFILLYILLSLPNWSLIIWKCSFLLLPNKIPLDPNFLVLWSSAWVISSKSNVQEKVDKKKIPLDVLHSLLSLLYSYSKWIAYIWTYIQTLRMILRKSRSRYDQLANSYYWVMN